MPPSTKFTFNFYRFIGEASKRTTELVRDPSQADGLRGLVDQNPNQVQLASERVFAWAATKGIALYSREPFPSTKYPGKVWLEFRFSGLAL